jgi:hypothetical protein
MARKRKARPSRRKLPWPRLGDPIDRLAGYADEDAQARREQYRRMLTLKKHYQIEGENGAKPWYDLALAIASELDDGLKIVGSKYTPPKGKTSRRWRGTEGTALVDEVLALMDGGEAKSVPKAVKMLQDLAPKRYGSYDLKYLEDQFYIARKRHP